VQPEREVSQDLPEALDPPDLEDLLEIWVWLVSQDQMDQLGTVENQEIQEQLDPPDHPENVE